MILSFTLTMPIVKTWNGKWTGSDSLYVVCRPIRFTKNDADKYASIIGKSFYYRFSDGWVACVSVEEVNSSTARRLRRNSKGFCGYEWMVNSIINNGSIKVPVRKDSWCVK